MSEREKQKLLYRPREYDDWGVLRFEDGTLFSQIVDTKIDQGELDKCRREWRDPYETRARRVAELWNEALSRTPAPEGVVSAAESLVSVIEAAGVNNLSNGVQIGQTAWFVKCSDSLNELRNALEAYKAGRAS